MTSFTAAVLTEIKKPLRLIEVEVPVLKRGQVLVKILRSGICQSQVAEIDGGRDNAQWLPHMLGHEGVGIVVDKSNDVRKVDIGDEVILTWIKGMGADAGGCVYQSDLGTINSGAVTTFSQYSVVSENRLFKNTENIPEDIAPFFGCAVPTGSGLILKNEANYSELSCCLIGLGGIGFCALMALKEKGCNNITVIDISDKKLKVAELLGNVKTVNPTYFRVEGLKNSFDRVFEAAGRCDTIELAFSLSKPGGQVIFASHPPCGTKICLDPYDFILGKKIIGSWGGGCVPETDLKQLVKVFGPNGSSLKLFAANEYDLSQINLAINDLREGKAQRPIINM